MHTGECRGPSYNTAPGPTCRVDDRVGSRARPKRDDRTAFLLFLPSASLARLLYLLTMVSRPICRSEDSGGWPLHPGQECDKVCPTNNGLLQCLQDCIAQWQCHNDVLLQHRTESACHARDSVHNRVVIMPTIGQDKTCVTQRLTASTCTTTTSLRCRRSRMTLITHR